LVQAELAKSFHSRLLPLQEAIDEVKTNVFDAVYQQLTSDIARYRFASEIMVCDLVGRTINKCNSNLSVLPIKLSNAGTGDSLVGPYIRSYTATMTSS